jgi:hypothetical protein
MRRIYTQAALLLAVLLLIGGGLALVVSSAGAQQPSKPASDVVAQTNPPPPSDSWASTMDSGAPSSNNGAVPAGKPAQTKPQLPAIPIGTPCSISTTIQGSLATGDTTMPARLNRDGVQATCATPKTYPGPITSTPPYYYDTYTFTNNSGSAQCVTASLEALTCNAQLSVYLTSFDPNNLATNYLADPGLSTGAGGTDRCCMAVLSSCREVSG